MNREEVLKLGRDIDELIYKYHDFGQKHAMQNSMAWFKEQSMKIILKEKMSEFLKDNNVSQSEIKALASKEYKDAVNETAEAKKLANSLSIDIKTIEFKLMAQFSLNKLAVAGGKIY